MSLKAQRGSLLIVALFVMLVLAGLGLTLTKVTSTSSDAVVYEVYGLRAMLAAQAGLNQNLARVFPVGGGAVCANISSGPGFTQVPGFEGCSYTSLCSVEDYVSADETLTFYRFSSKGQCQAGEITVSRTVAVDASVSVPN